MKSAYDWDIDFDAWSALAADDPGRFEQRRSELIGEVIGLTAAERQQRLKCLQWRIDKIRQTSHTPLAACIKLSKMMHDSVLGKGGLQERLYQSLGRIPATPQIHNATILPFRRPAAD